MVTAFSILIGVFASLTLLVAVIWLSLAWERRSSARKRSWLASRSGNIDEGPSVGYSGSDGYTHSDAGHGGGDAGHH
jgi:hypothetical protein